MKVYVHCCGEWQETTGVECCEVCGELLRPEAGVPDE